MDPAALLVFGLALFVAAATPGPAIAAVVARVIGRGRQGAVAFSAGMALGDVVWLTLVILGVAALAQSFQGAFLAVKWAGVAYLGWLAWKMVNARPASAGPEGGPPVRGERTLALVAAGLAVTLGNPKAMMFYLALVPTLLDVTRVTLLGYAELVAVTGGVLGLVFGAYTALALRARRLLTSPEARARIDRGAGLALAGAAGWIAAR